MYKYIFTDYGNPCKPNRKYAQSVCECGWIAHYWRVIMATKNHQQNATNMLGIAVLPRVTLQREHLVLWHFRVSHAQKQSAYTRFAINYGLLPFTSCRQATHTVLWCVCLVKAHRNSGTHARKVRVLKT